MAEQVGSFEMVGVNRILKNSSSSSSSSSNDNQQQDKYSTASNNDNQSITMENELVSKELQHQVATEGAVAIVTNGHASTDPNTEDIVDSALCDVNKTIQYNQEQYQKQICEINNKLCSIMNRYNEGGSINLDFELDKNRLKDIIVALEKSIRRKQEISDQIDEQLSRIIELQSRLGPQAAVVSGPSLQEELEEAESRSVFNNVFCLSRS